MAPTLQRLEVDYVDLVSVGQPIAPTRLVVRAMTDVVPWSKPAWGTSEWSAAVH